MKGILITLMAFLLTIPVLAQEEAEQSLSYDYNISLDFQTRYIWRGQPLGGSSPSFQPGMSFSWKGLTVGTWGAFGFNNQPIQELDFYLSYTFWKDRFTVTITDYGAPEEGNNRFDYFDYPNTHVLEGGFSYNGEEKVPVSASIYCIFYGADAKKENDKNIFSSYAEVSYNPTFKKIGVDFSVWIGCAINGTDWSTTDTLTGIVTPHAGFYGNTGFACVNTGISARKSFPIGKKLTLPLSTSLIFNPDSKKAYLVGTVGLAL
ncbi:MAG: hypothetical protein LBL13_10850 [Bacteroidales bacterium]|jgi:uncharacterized protein (TIGR02001 family)|nr:hypothetical protein [Bacteroidales bacterium]